MLVSTYNLDLDYILVSMNQINVNLSSLHYEHRRVLQYKVKYQC